MPISRDEISRRITTLEGAYGDCHICPEHCGVNRESTILGTCGLGTQGRVYKEFLHFGEEPEISPTHAIYLAGCNFRCKYCSDLKEVTAPTSIEPTDESWLAQQIHKRQQQGAQSVSFVGGSPDVQPLFVLRVLRDAPPDLPVVWNSNLWLTPETLGLLEGVVDIFVSDLKYGPGGCDQKLSSVEQSFSTILNLLKQIHRGGSKLMIRHLLLPGHAECCTMPVLEALAEYLPGTYTNLMTGYRPFYLRGTQTPLGTRLSASEAQQTVDLAEARYSRSLFLRKDGRPL